MASWLPTITIVGAIVLAGLVWLFLRTRRSDLLDGLMKKYQGSATLVSRGDYVEGMEHIPVAMALVGNEFHYENPDMQASFELDRIDEVEYDNELATGKNLEHGQEALRLRSHGTTFEYVLSPADAQRWKQALPPRRLGGTQVASGQ
jgi:hypothetical protein